MMLPATSAIAPARPRPRTSSPCFGSGTGRIVPARHEDKLRAEVTMRRRIAAAVAAVAALSSCRTTGLFPTHATGKAAAGEATASPLTREMAAARAGQLSRVSYALWFGLDAEAAEYQGRVAIGFELAKDAEGDLLVDFEDGAVHSISVNGVAVPAAELARRYDSHRLRFATGELVRGGANRIEIAFAHATSTTGNGLHRFVDPADGRVYTYSNFEPYNANRMFPCFDQPDLKASYELTVEVPSEWTVIANTREREVTRAGERSTWRFPPSAIFATYIFALHAGPYASWSGKAGPVPIRLFARKS